MKDVFLQSTDKESMLVDLKSVYGEFFEVDVDGNEILRQAGENFAIDYIGALQKPGTGEWDEEGNEVSPVEFYDGVHCNIRLEGSLESLFDGFTSAKTKDIQPKTPSRVFAG